MKKVRTSTKSKVNLAAEIARVEEKLSWGLLDVGLEVEPEEKGRPVEPEPAIAIELRHPQL